MAFMPDRTRSRDSHSCAAVSSGARPYSDIMITDRADHDEAIEVITIAEIRRSPQGVDPPWTTPATPGDPCIWRMPARPVLKRNLGANETARAVAACNPRHPDALANPWGETASGKGHTLKM
jgi:hypothetical protein